MTDRINIQTREEFNSAINLISKATMVVADTETNGLDYYRGNYIISISVFLPEFDASFNFPFRHGEGEVDVRYNANNTALKSYADMNWTGHAKKDLFLSWAFKVFKDNVPASYFGNIPVEWMSELKDNWGLEGVTYLFHNARFDLHMLHQEGFPTPAIVWDTLLGLHFVHEDWGGIQLEAPFRDKTGRWATSDDGTALKKTQYGNRQLKWQAMFWGLPDASVGEMELIEAKEDFELLLAQFVADNHLFDEKVDDLRYTTYNKTPDKPITYKQVERIQSKLNLHEKSHMWMLPSRDVWLYAVKDTELTYYLWQKILPILEEWDNVALFENVCAIQTHVAWEMEKNGLKIDMDEARRQRKVYKGRIQSIEDSINSFAGHAVNINSNKDLPVFLKWGVTKTFPVELIPEWISPKKVAKWDNFAHVVEEGQLEKTNKTALEPFKDHPAVQLVLEYRKLKKAVGTYLNNWMKAPDANNIVRGRMNPDGTVAGRFSSSGKPLGNIQNIPDRGGYTIKKVFVPYDNNWMLFAIDYGQLEARIASWIAENLLPQQGAYTIEEAVMTRLFNSGEDMHSYVRDMVNVRDVLYAGMTDAEIAGSTGVNPTSMAEDELADYVAKKVCRQVAKTLNFGLLYSGTYKMVAKLLKIKDEPARELEHNWRKLFPAFEKAQMYYEDLAQTWRKTPSGNGRGMYITQPITGRHRKFHKYSTWMWFYEDGIRKGFNPRSASARKGWNNVVQGLSGWMSVDSALRYYNDYSWDGMKLFAQIHDADDGQVRVDSLWRVKKLMEYMVDYPTNPALTVDLEAGYNWQPKSDDNPTGLWEVANVDLWIETQGQYGYHTKRDGKGTYTDERYDEAFVRGLA